MRHGRRNVLIVVGLLVLTAAVVAAVLGFRSGDVTTLGTSADGGGRTSVVAQTPTPAPTSGAQSGLLDPAKQEPILDLFTAKGLHRDDLLAAALITPSCGCGSLAVETADQVLKLTGEVSKALQERYA